MIRFIPPPVTVLTIATCFLTGCTHTETFQRTMTWSAESNGPELSEPPKGAVRMTFIAAPKFHVRLSLPAVKEISRSCSEARSSSRVRGSLQEPPICDDQGSFRRRRSRPHRPR